MTSYYSQPTRHQNHLRIFSGVLLLILFVILTAISANFEYKIPLLKKPTPGLVSILIIAGAVYLFSIPFLQRTPHSRNLLIWIIIVGGGLRIVTIFSTPMLEDDYFRYLWDGAVAANGFNPYSYAPQVITEGRSSIPAEIRLLAEESGEVIQRINHPHIRTIYPPVTQGFFALSHLISPWSITMWRFILLLTDAVNLVLLFYLLKYLKLPSILVAIYWWNPLLVKEIFNSGHMDIIALPIVLGAILLLLKNKPIVSSGILALGIGVKLWPALLFPLFLRRIHPDYKKMMQAVFVFVIVSLLIFLPVFLSNIDDTSGFKTYGSSWENNDSMFRLLVWGWQLIFPLFEVHPGHGQFAARITVFALLIVLILFLIRRPCNDGFTLVNRSMIVLAAAFLISPTQFPWYYVWLIPFLTLNPRISLLILTALLPLYYLRFYLEPRGLISWFDYGVVWIEFVPVWILIIRDWYKSRKDKAVLLETTSM